MDEFERLVTEERRRQDEKWGEQNHHPLIWLAILGEEYGELQKATVENYFFKFYHTPASQIIKELSHVAAVAKAMYESLRRQKIL